MIPKLVIFDCDGVLVDTEGPVNEVLAANLSRHGLPITPEHCENLFIGGTVMDVFDKARRLGANLPDDWIEGLYTEVLDRLEQGAATIPGVLDLIATLEDRGVAIWVASNGPMRKMRVSLGPSGLWDRFAGRIMSREQFTPKPAADMPLHAIRETGAPLDLSVMIDDSAPGCLSARNAGIRCLGFAERGQHDTLAAAGAEPINSMNEAATLLGL
ncbi:HAD family phosphatase [uncultured Shimia sp.]|uniref:HAD family hydrolase n=1 Tax=uncultured Shimia sp. TaxID=573152 RepID=UPI0026029F29|nr:HAD family phosphatase [uncultured Shimia sp.]